MRMEGFPLQADDLIVAGRQGIHFDVVGGRQPFIKAIVPGMIGIVGQYRHGGAFHATQMPLPKVRRGIACLLKRLGQCLFLQTKSLVKARHAGSLGNPSRKDRSPLGEQTDAAV